MMDRLQVHSRDGENEISIKKKKLKKLNLIKIKEIKFNNEHVIR